MFKLSTELTFRWPIKPIEPDPENPGKLIEREFTGIFKIIAPEKAKASDEARREILKRATADATVETLTKANDDLKAHDLAAARDVLTGWEGIVGDDDKPLPFNDDTFAAAHAHDHVRAAIVRAYAEAISQDRARLKN